MPFHLVGFHDSIPTDTDGALSFIGDDVFGDLQGMLVSSSKIKALAGFAMGNTLQTVKLWSASLAAIIDSPHVRPIVSSAAMISDPNLAEWFDHPILLQESEPLQARAIQSSGGNADAYLLLWLAEEIRALPSGDSTTVRGTGTATTTANAWTDVDITWDVRLGRGRYAVVAAECVSSNALAFRLKFDSDGFRPGGLTMASTGDKPPKYFSRPSAFGLWGYATEMVMPRLQVLSTAASSSHTLYLKVVRVG